MVQAPAPGLDFINPSIHVFMDYWRNAISGKPDERQLEGAAAMFDALSDTSRLKTLVLLAGKELSVSEIAAAEGEKMTTVSARLQILHAARLIARRRKGKSVIYSIADDHVLMLVENAVAHAAEKH